jgi:hypothetical protein
VTDLLTDLAATNLKTAQAVSTYILISSVKLDFLVVVYMQIIKDPHLPLVYNIPPAPRVANDWAINTVIPLTIILA